MHNINNQYTYIIDLYNPFSLNKSQAEYIYTLNERRWAIFKVICKDNLPQLPLIISDDIPDPSSYHLYNTYQQALSYVQQLKQIAR